jgi:hypothetical protein
MDSPIFIQQACMPTRRGSSRNPLRILQRNWRKAVVYAAAPGRFWHLTAVLVVDALVLGSITANQQWLMTPVSAIGCVPFAGVRGTHCYCGPWFRGMVVAKDKAGIWAPLSMDTQEEYRRQEQLAMSTPATPGVALVTFDRPSDSTIGLWSPLIGCHLERAMSVAPLDPAFTAADEQAVRAAAVAAWRRPNDRPYAEVEPPTEAEAQAALAGTRPIRYTVRPLAVANDAAVAGISTLVLASMPRRLRRRAAARALIERAPITHCPLCRYELAGLPEDEYGVRTCPECGKVSSQFF